MSTWTGSCRSLFVFALAMRGDSSGGETHIQMRNIMIKRMIVAGGRDHRLSPLEKSKIAEVALDNPGIEIVSGGARGVDTDAAEWAKKARGVNLKMFPANWNKYGKAAGMIRNGQMAKYADALMAFPGGRGTANMLKTAREEGLEIFDYTKGVGT